MHALPRSRFFDPKTIEVTSDDGTVRLTGAIHSVHDDQLAAAIALAPPRGPRRGDGGGKRDRHRFDLACQPGRAGVTIG
jgi:hypothetical protein